MFEDVPRFRGTYIVYAATPPWGCMYGPTHPPTHPPTTPTPTPSPPTTPTLFIFHPYHPPTNTTPHSQSQIFIAADAAKV